MATTLGALARVAPRLADPLLERLFLTAPRPRRPEWERERLFGARRGFLEVDGLRLPTWTWGSEGPLVLLVHGWGGRGSQLGAFVQPLVDAGHRVMTFDGPGHGDAPKSLTSIVAIARAVQAAARHHGPFEALIAHSVGGAATTWAATDARIARRYVFIGAPAHPRDFIAQFAAALRLGRTRVDALVARIQRRYGVDFASLDVATGAREQDAPLLLVHDEGDVEVPIGHAAGYTAGWRGATLHRTQGLGHRRILRDAGVIERVVTFVAPRARGRLSAEAMLERELFERERRWARAA